MGTSTRTTPAVRRALKNPISEVPVATTGTATALQASQCGQSTGRALAKDASQINSRPASRKSVRTNMDENQPMLSRPTHFHASGNPGLFDRAPMKGSGMVAADSASAAASSTAQPAGKPPASASTSRRPM